MPRWNFKPAAITVYLALIDTLKGKLRIRTDIAETMTQSQYIYEVDTENYGRIVVEGSRSVPVLVDFWAEWCQPCKLLMPILARLAEAYQGKFILAKINTEEQQAIAAEFGIRSIPTVKLFRHGEPVDEFMGALPESEIRAFLDRHIPRESDQLVAQADQLIQAGKTEQAVKLIEQAPISTEEEES